MNKLFTLLLVCAGITTSFAQEYYFPSAVGTEWATIPPSDLGWCGDRIDSLYTMLADNNTHAFIILKDGKIVLEKYFEPFGRDSIWYWASAGKSLTSVLVGIAQQQGFLDIHDTTSFYLGDGWTSCSETGEHQITIRDQLTMTTGLNDEVADLDCTTDACLSCLADPGTRWAYHNAPYTLLHEVLSSATGQSVNFFLQNRVTDLTGIDGLFVPIGYNKVFLSRARDMARFGLLMLNKGRWDNVDVLADSIYYQDMVHPSQSLNPAYGYLWWLNGQDTYMLPGLQHVFNGSLIPNAPEDMFAALGKNGQFINIVPSQGLVMIRMGDAPSELAVPVLLNDMIWSYINELECITSARELTSLKIRCDVFPNPATNGFTIEVPGHRFDVSIYDAFGKFMLKEVNCENTVTIKDKFPPGMYYLKIETETNLVTRKLLVQH